MIYQHCVAIGRLWGWGEGDWSVTTKRATKEIGLVYCPMYTIYYILYRVTFRELLEDYGGWGGGRFVGPNKKSQYRESTSILTDIYHILYRVTLRELLEGYGEWEEGW